MTSSQFRFALHTRQTSQFYNLRKVGFEDLRITIPHPLNEHTNRRFHFSAAQGVTVGLRD